MSENSENITCKIITVEGPQGPKGDAGQDGAPGLGGIPYAEITVDQIASLPVDGSLLLVRIVYPAGIDPAREMADSEYRIFTGAKKPNTAQRVAIPDPVDLPLSAVAQERTYYEMPLGWVTFHTA